MKNLFILLLSSSTLILSAQVADRTVTDCNQNTRSIYAALGAGKPLVVASKGFDCSICRSSAPNLQSWASQNPSVEVWGAMTYTYSGNTPTCSNVNSWVTQYTWNSIFSFVDGQRDWFKFGTPRYYVYDPADSTIAYEGSSQATALSTALSLVPNNVSQREIPVKEFAVSAGEGYISLYDLPEGPATVQILSLTGAVVHTADLSSPSDVEEIRFDKYTSGIYLVSVQNKSGFQAVRKVYMR